MAWDLRAGGVEIAREAVRIRLHAYGELKGLSIQDSDRALSPLFEHVAHKAVEEKRSLSREDFRVVFDTATHESVPKAELAMLRMISAQFTHGIPAMAIATAGWDAGLETTLPPFPVPCCPRAALAHDLTSILLRHRFLALSGSTGTGKSTLAKLVATRSSQRWLWINCGGRDAAHIDFRLRDLAKQLARANGPVSVLFDSFDFDGVDLARMCRSLAAAVILILRTGGCVAVTSQRFLPELFRREVPFPDGAFTSVPPLKEEEIEEFCALAGCADVGQRTIWSRIIWFQTQGHPQLTHARVSVAARRGWPAANPADVVQTPEDIREERALARQLLREIDAGQRELLFRLSIGSRPFRPDHAVAVGEIVPAIQEAGDGFDALVGPWIERRGQDYYRLSPLLTDAAEANWSADRVRAMRIEYARAVMRCGNATLWEASEVLFQAVLVQDDQLAGSILARVMMAPRKHLPGIASELEWLLLFSSEQPVFPRSPFINLTLRQVQFRLAVVSDHRQAVKLAELLNAESRKSIDAKIDYLVRGGATADILLAFKVPVHPSTLLECWLDADRLAKTSQLREFTGAIEKKRPTRFGLARLGFSHVMFGFILARNGGASFLREFIAAVERLDDQEQEKVFVAIRENRTRLQLFIDNIWTGELSKPTRDWADVVDALNTARTAGVRWKLPEMIVAAARGIAAVQDEYLAQPDLALATLNAAAQQAGAEALMLRYQRGTIFFRQKRYQEAYDSWGSTLEEWPTDDFEASLQALLAHSHCGIAAGLLGNWQQAAQAFRRACDIAQKNRRRVERAEFGVDAAYAMWRSGERAAAVSEFAFCLGEIEKFASSRKEPEELHTLWKLTEQIIRWCAQNAGAPQSMAIPTPRQGVCSELRERTEHAALEKYPRGPLVWLWYSLAEAEFCAGVGSLAFSKLMSRVDAPKYPWLQSLIGYLKVRTAFEHQDFDSLVQIVEGTAHASAIAKANPMDTLAFCTPNESPTQVDDYTSEVFGWAPEVFALALVVLVAVEKDVLAAIENWKRRTAEAKSSFDYRGLLDQAAQLLTSDPGSAHRAYSARPSGRFQQIVSALRMGTDPDSSLAACFVGLMTLVTDEPLAQGHLDIRQPLGLLVKNVWEQRICFPAEFNSPRVSIPAIKAACEAPYEGLALAAHILLAAQTAVSVRALDSSIAELRLLAGISHEH